MYYQSVYALLLLKQWLILDDLSVAISEAYIILHLPKWEMSTTNQFITNHITARKYDHSISQATKMVSSWPELFWNNSQIQTSG